MEVGYVCKKMGAFIPVGATIVFALDFLFWDSTLKSISGSLLALDQLISHLKRTIFHWYSVRFPHSYAQGVNLRGTG